VYEKGLIFEDGRLQCFVAEFENLEKSVVHFGQDVWFEMKLIDNAHLPLNNCYQSTFYLNMKDIFYSKNMNLLKELLGTKLEHQNESFENTLTFLSY